MRTPRLILCQSKLNVDKLTPLRVGYFIYYKKCITYLINSIMCGAQIP